jgi:hypothetical protein
VAWVILCLATYVDVAYVGMYVTTEYEQHAEAASHERRLSRAQHPSTADLAICRHCHPQHKLLVLEIVSLRMHSIILHRNAEVYHFSGWMEVPLAISFTPYHATLYDRDGRRV